MIETIYTELPIEDITSMYRPEFYKEEKEFKKALTQSMTKSGMKDPVYCWYQSKPYGNKAIITNFKADQFPLKGRILKTDEEIKNLFHLPNQVEVRRDKNGEVDQINHPKFQGDIINEYVSTT